MFLVVLLFDAKPKFLAKTYFLPFFSAIFSSFNFENIFVIFPCCQNMDFFDNLYNLVYTEKI